MLGAPRRSDATSWGSNCLKRICKQKTGVAAPGSDSDFRACVPLNICAMLKWGFGHCQEQMLVRSPSQSWGRPNCEAGGVPLPSFGIYTTAEEHKPCPTLPPSAGTKQPPACCFFRLRSFTTRPQEMIQLLGGWGLRKILSGLWLQLSSLPRMRQCVGYREIYISSAFQVWPGTNSVYNLHS